VAATGGGRLLGDDPDDETDIDDPGGGIQQIIWSVQTDTPQAALSFDDGPHPDFTPQILDILDDHGVSATFMAMGHQAEHHPDLLLDVVGAGHEVGHHTWQHKNLANIGDTEARAQVDNGVRLIEEVTGQRLRWFRPPRGRLSEAAIRLIAQHRHDIVLWSVSRGALAERSPRRVADYVIERTGPGDIIDFHDGIGRGTFDPDGDTAEVLTERRRTEVEALPLILRGLEERGVQLRRIGDIAPTNREVMT
jgi:peptidoglycan/xylan/chitin deacetylase (PgdA/CDA1 family)